MVILIYLKIKTLNTEFDLLRANQKGDSNKIICIFEFMISKNDIINKLRDLKPILYRDYFVKEIGLFGSFSDDSYSEDSDIDLLVEFEKPIGWKYFSLEIYLENIFGRKIDLVTKNALKEQIKDSILNQVKYI